MRDIKYDLYRLVGNTSRKEYIKNILLYRPFRKIVYYRWYNKCGKIMKILVRILNYFLSKKLTIDMPFSAKIGKGILLLHPYSIVLNSNTVIGENCTLMKGCTIGNSKTGKVGTPKIGNNVYIGLNSTVVGGITVGNNVMIAANTFVNFDVPDDSIVIGSPGVIHAKEKASIPYIINSITDIV